MEYIFVFLFKGVYHNYVISNSFKSISRITKRTFCADGEICCRFSYKYIYKYIYIYPYEIAFLYKRSFLAVSRSRWRLQRTLGTSDDRRYAYSKCSMVTAQERRRPSIKFALSLNASPYVIFVASDPSSDRKRPERSTCLTPSIISKMAARSSRRTWPFSSSSYICTTTHTSVSVCVCVCVCARSP